MLLDKSQIKQKGIPWPPWRVQSNTDNLHWKHVIPTLNLQLYGNGDYNFIMPEALLCELCFKYWLQIEKNVRIVCKFK